MPTKRTTRNPAKPETRARRFALTVQYAGGKADDLPGPRRFRRWLEAALVRGRGAQVTLRIVGEAEGRRLNARYRRRARATNVLAFAYEPAPRLAGDIVLCAPVMRREARAQGKALDAHCAHLGVHGMLHLQGYDHHRDSDARRMERLETVILAGLGYADPYGERRTKAESGRMRKSSTPKR